MEYITITYQIFLKIFSKMTVISWNEFKNTTVKNFQYFLSHPQLTDVTLAMEDNKEIKAHKIILCNGSTFFQKLFYKSPDKTYFNIREIHPTISFKEFETIIKFIYLGECEMEPSELESILCVGKDLEIVGLTEYRQDFFIHFPCTQCEYKSFDYSSLTKHMQNNHTEFRTTNPNNINDNKRTLPKEVKVQRKREKIDCDPNKIISRNFSNKNPEEMSCEEVDEEIKIYIEGETEKERKEYLGAARKRARDRIVKKPEYRNIKKPGVIDENKIKLDMLKDFIKQKALKKPGKTSRSKDENDLNRKASKRPRKMTIVSEDKNTPNHNVNIDGGNRLISHLEKDNNSISHNQDVNFTMGIDGVSVQNQKANKYSQYLQESNNTTSSSLEAVDISFNDMRTSYIRQDGNYYSNLELDYIEDFDLDSLLFSQ